MRMDDIQVDGVYRAVLGYRQRTGKVRVTQKQATYEVGRGTARVGVRVVLEEPFRSPLSFERLDAGAELVLPSRKIVAAWTQEDQDALEEDRAEELRKQRIEELLGRAGFRRDEWEVEGDFDWRGEWLMIRGVLCDRLIRMIEEEE